MMEKYTIERIEWEGTRDEAYTYFATAREPMTGHAESEREAVEKLAENLEAMAKAIRTGEIYFVKVGYGHDDEEST